MSQVEETVGEKVLRWEQPAGWRGWSVGAGVVWGEVMEVSGGHICETYRLGPREEPPVSPHPRAGLSGGE